MVDSFPADIVRIAAEHFGLSRQAVHKHLSRLIKEGAIVGEGQSRARRYRLATTNAWMHTWPLRDTPPEDQVWLHTVRPSLADLPRNVLSTWHFGFTEMFNNALEHSEGTRIEVDFARNHRWSAITLRDDGIGIFQKVQSALGLSDPRHAVIELAKGKFTTDPANHSGEGIFFTSRAFDRLLIESHEVEYSSRLDDNLAPTALGWEQQPGTTVRLLLANDTSRTLKEAFDVHTIEGDDGYAFARTSVPVRLMHYGDDELVSRSQGRRLLSRFERFRVIELDFSGVESVGQAFADEVFRVFASRHPEVVFEVTHATPAVAKMIARARALAEENGRR
jgi:anti-sigma regulatory factor (Ser/Thr protein kinase)